MRSLRHRLWSSLLALALAACAPPPPPAPPAPPPPPAPTGTRLTDVDVRDIAALLRLEDRREFDDSLLTRLLGRPTVEVRRRAALAVGRIGDRRGVPLLLTALASDTSPRVEAGAAFALGLLRDSSAAVVSALAKRLDPGPGASPAAVEAAVEAVGALGKLRTADARDALESRVLAVNTAAVAPTAPACLGDARCRPLPAPLVGEALLNVWKAPRGARTTSIVLPYATSPDTAIRWRAVYALMRLGDPAAVPALRTALSDSSHLVRELAARALRRSVADSAGAGIAVRVDLTRALRDPHPHVRINAARALSTFRDSADVAPIAALLADPDTNVAIAAAEALGALGSADAAPALERVAGALLPLALRSAALTALVSVAPGRGSDRAAAWAADSAWLRRYDAALALGGSRYSLAAATLTRLATDADPRVSAAALESLATLAGDTIPLPRALYIESLDAADPIVRAAATRGLGRQADASDFGLFLDAYQRAARDTTMDDAAVAAIDVLGELAGKRVPVRRAFFVRFPRSADPVVRRVAVERLGDGWGEVGPIETGRDMAFYERVVRTLVAPELAGDSAPRVRIRTAGGDVVVQLAGAEAPLTTWNFLRLVRDRFFEASHWHRVVPDFVAQDGDPRGDGNGGPGYAIRDEINPLRYLRGTIGMALSGPDTGGSQFFITLSPQPHLDGGYTVFGRVVEGIEAVDRIVQGDSLGIVEASP